MENREDLFKQAAQKRKEETESTFTFTQYEEYDYLPMAINKQMAWKQFRILGNPLDGRQSDVFSPKIVAIAWIIGDNGKFMRVVYPTKQENPNWILYKIMNKVLRYDYDKESKTRKYHNTHVPVFNQLFSNGTNDPRNKGWEPNKLVTMNVIDRQQMAWHREHKHTVLLSKSSNTKDDKTYFESGVAQAFYEMLWNDVVEFAGDWHNYDVVAKRLDKDPWYKVLHAVEDYKKFAHELNTFDFNAETAGAPLTQEEMSWERYNLDEMFKPTSYRYILNRLNAIILQVDLTFKTNFLDELQTLVAIEEKDKPVDATPAAIPALPVANDPVPVPPNFPAPVSAPAPAPVAEVVAPPMTRTVVEEQPVPVRVVGIDWAGLEALGFKGAALLKPEARAEVVSVNADGTFTWKSGPMYGCPTCGFQSPQIANVCPKCCAKFE